MRREPSFCLFVNAFQKNNLANTHKKICPPLKKKEGEMEKVYIGPKKDAPPYVKPSEKCDLDVVTQMPIEDDEIVIVTRDERGSYHCDVLSSLAQLFVHAVISNDKLPVYPKNRSPISLSLYREVLTSARENDPSFYPWMKGVIEEHSLSPERVTLVQTGERGTRDLASLGTRAASLLFNVTMTRGSRPTVEVLNDGIYTSRRLPSSVGRGRRSRRPPSPSSPPPPRRRRSRRR